MPRTLLETIQSNLKSSPTTTPNQASPVQPDLGQTQQVKSLLRAKSGREVAPESGPRQSALQERIAARQVEQAGKQVQQEGRLKAEQLEQIGADIEQREEQQAAQSAQRLEAMQRQADREANALMESMERAGREFDTKNYLSELEQVGFNLRLNNQQYLDNLHREADRARLNNKLEFREQVAIEVFAKQTKLLENELAFRSLIDANDREFEEQLQQMDLDQAIELADEQIAGSMARMRYEAVGGLASAGAQALDAYGSGKFKSKNEEDKNG